MQEPQSILGLGLARQTEVAAETVPAPESLQFRKAENLAESGSASQTCSACKRAFAAPYFHANGMVVCPVCAHAIESNQQAPPHHSLAKAFVYGLGAAVGGSILYATVAIITGLELALIAILIGYMVGKAIRHASGGLGGRPQQVMAVLLTYFAITTSYIPVMIHHYATTAPKPAAQPAPAGIQKTPPVSVGQAVLTLLMLALAAPFLSLNSMGGLLSLLIIFFGLQRAWRMTARSELVVSGPYGT